MSTLIHDYYTKLKKDYEFFTINYVEKNTGFACNDKPKFCITITIYIQSLFLKKI